MNGQTNSLPSVLRCCAFSEVLTGYVLDISEPEKNITTCRRAIVDETRVIYLMCPCHCSNSNFRRSKALHKKYKGHPCGAAGPSTASFRQI